MGKRGKFFLYIVALVLFGYLFFTNLNSIKVTLITISNNIKSSALNFSEKISSTLEYHIKQAKKIEGLQSKIKEIEPKASLFVEVSAKLNHLLKDVDLKKRDTKLHLVSVLSYRDMTKRLDQFWLEFKDFDPNRQYGLLYKGFAAGVVVEKDQKPVANMISSKEAIFSVVIGEDRIEGVAFGDGEFIKVKYIPKYKDPKVGDEVITSGFDHIFYEGIKVGRVIQVIIKDMYKEAIVKPFVVLDNPRYMYAVETE